MSPTDFKRIERLMKLANAADEFEFISPDLVVHFSYVREDLGLAKTLNLIKEYVEHKTNTKNINSLPSPQTPQTD
jgi:hypothetical protein